MVKRGQTLLRELKASPPRNAAEPKFMPFFCRNLSRFCQVHFVTGRAEGSLGVHLMKSPPHKPRFATKRAA
jgi:hypothetical protein